MFDNKQKNRKSGLILFLIFYFIFFNFKHCQATGIPVMDELLNSLQLEYNALDLSFSSWDKWRIEAKELEQKISSNIFAKVVNSAMKKIAFDTATWLGSGGKGQKPLFITESWGTYLTNIADEAGGEYIEELFKGGWGLPKFNLCEPNLSVKIGIGLGLVATERPKAPACTFSKMRENWKKALDDPKFLDNVQDMFNPTSNDLGVTLALHQGIIEEKEKKKEEATKKREVNQGWLNVENLVTGADKAIPGLGSMTAYLTYAQAYEINQDFGSILENASNVFLNQYFLTLVKTKLANLGKKSYTSPYSGNYGGITSADANPAYSGLTGMQDTLKKIMQPDFSVNADFEVLQKLAVCPDPTDPGTTDCVIDSKFSQAIQNKETVGAAIADGYLNPQFAFGFLAGGQEPAYNQGYPYRSMIILRKYRIIPVGWELAAQYIEDTVTSQNNNIVSLGDMVACYDNDDNYPGYYADWCKGLVDPSWVLKAPLSFCKKQGPGPKIISSRVTQNSVNSNSNELTSQLSLTRDEKYCADEQSCIKEDNDGSCKFYGYCTEDKRRWKFDSDSCEPIYNTCQTYKKSGGESISYLANTLDYGSCSADNVGCRGYSQSYSSYATTTDIISWTNGTTAYFDRDVEECGADNEGCHLFVRTVPGKGTNLFLNSNFEDSNVAFGVQSNSSSFSGAHSVSVAGNANFVAPIFNSGSNPTIDLEGEAYTFSLYARNCGTGNITLGTGGDSSAVAMTNSADWQRFSVTHVFVGGSQVHISIAGTAGCLIDAVKLEKGMAATSYSDYMANNVIYEKLMPNYLADECFVDSNGDGYMERINSSLNKCNDYARTCTETEVGCDMYKPKSGISVPAKIKQADYCPAACVGYKNYFQSATNFENEDSANFIPKTAAKCNAAAAGCDEFTNLDALEKGGETREYYTFLKQCRLPDDQCGDFYTWEGNSETGYQLKVFSLEQLGGVPTGGNNYLGRTCATIADYNPVLNPECREFYARDGSVYYKFLPLTRTCSTNCHPYRRTITENPGAGACVNGGTWDAEHGACVYMAIPGEGVACAAAKAGCREYSGSLGNNIQTIISDSFEGSNAGWSGTLESESINVGGHSLLASGNARKTIGNLVNSGNAYSLKFIVKSNTTVTITASVGNSTSTVNFEGSVDLVPNEWKVVELNLADLDHEIYADESLTISGGNFYIDNIILTEITDRYYLIKDSWVMPTQDGRDICNWNLITDFAENGYSLGCDQYTDTNKNTVYLHSFNQLCQDSAVGCEMMIDTHNLDSGTTTDNFIYAVYNKDKECNSSDKGCERLGKQSNYAGQYSYEDVYLKNNPNKYQTIMCDEPANGCEEWTTNDSTVYFKDPGDQTCEYRQAAITDSSGFGWYKKKVKKCDVNGDSQITAADGAAIPVCSSDNNCLAATGDPAVKCVLDNNDIPCAIDYYKTIGIGGVNSQVAQPGIETLGSGSYYWAGVCPSEQSTCTEYIDPISKFNSNIVNNPDFDNLDGNTATVDRWFAQGGGSYRQSLGVNNYTLYRLSGKNDSARTITLSCANPLFSLDINNELVPLGGNAYTLDVPAGNYESSYLLYTANNTSCTISINGAFTPGIGTVQFKPAIIDYQLKLDESAECNGTVNEDTNCILFNERMQNGNSKSGLIYDADRSPVLATKGAATCSGTTCNSNKILKVTPDRDCANWLYCKRYSQDDNGKQVCYDLGLCQGVDSKGTCNNPVVKQAFLNPATTENQIYDSVLSEAQIRNLTGYSKVGYGTSPANSVLGQNDLFHISTMVQEGSSVDNFNGNFEDTEYIANAASSTCAGFSPRSSWWRYYNSTQSWCASYFEVLNDPVKIQKENASYKKDGFAPEGIGFLKFGSNLGNLSPYSRSIAVSPGNKYIISAYINTKDLAPVNGNSAFADISIVAFDNVGNILPNGIINYSSDPDYILRAAFGNDWKLYVGYFNVSPSVASIRLHLHGTPAATAGSSVSGSIYMDDIKMRPALKIKDTTPTDQTDNSFWYGTQTCRLYPKADSPSCNYIEESGYEQKGLYGYCLEYDRYPGSSDNCLMWYPIDRANGDNMSNEMLSYDGRYPLYYATALRWMDVDISATQNSIYRNNECRPDCQNNDCVSPNPFFPRDFVNSSNEWLLQFLDKRYIQSIELSDYLTDIFDGNNCNPSQLDTDNSVNDWGPGDRPENYTYSSYVGEPLPTFYDWCTAEWWHAGGGSGYYRGKTFRAIFNESGALQSVHMWEYHDGETNHVYSTEPMEITIHLRIPYASEIVQVVNDNGIGVPWNARMQSNSIFTSRCTYPPANNFNCVYGSDYYPFGAAVTPSGDPDTWSGRIKTGAANIPLLFETPNTTLTTPYQPRAGQLHAVNQVQNLFARSNSTWRSTGGGYSPVGGATSYWSSPPTVCAGGVRQPFNGATPLGPAYYCSIPPELSNISLNGITGDLVVRGSQFVNLTFNSKVDPEQLPLNLIRIDWGDGSANTIIDNASLRDRQDINNPHSFTYIYSYSAIASYYNSNPAAAAASGITCGTDNTLNPPIDYCRTRPRILIQDNWEWCNNGTAEDDCNTYVSYPNDLIIYAQ